MHDSLTQYIPVIYYLSILSVIFMQCVHVYMMLLSFILTHFVICDPERRNINKLMLKLTLRHLGETLWSYKKPT